jgi:hypothetical protein
MSAFFLLSLLTLAACGGTVPPPTTPTPTTCNTTPAPANSGPSQTLSTDNHIYTIKTQTIPVPQVTRFWRAGTIVITLVSTCGSFSIKNQQATSNRINGEVQAIFNKLLLPNESVHETSVAPLEDNTGLPGFIWLGNTATLFLYIQTQQNGSPTLTPIGDDNLEKAVNVLNNNNVILQSSPINIDPTLTVVINSASPDWLSEGGGGGYTGGHPDGPPDQAVNDKATATTCNSSSGPTVYVLDTAYPLGAASAHVTTSHPVALNTVSISADLRPTAPPNSPGCDTFLDMADATQEMDVQLADSPLDDFRLKIFNPYSVNPLEFQEHGLFISALIHHIAPQASIRLIRVLNDWGAGDLQALFYGFSLILNGGQKGAIVNMSLGVLPPLVCLENIWDATTSDNSSQIDNFTYWEARYAGTQNSPLVNFTHCNGDLTQTVAKDPNTRRLYNSLALMIHQLAKEGDILVAASGNESTGIVPPLGAELPAALCDVIAVGATTGIVGSNWHYSPGTPLAGFSNAPYFAGTSCLSFNPASNSLQISNSGANHAVIAVGVGICSLLLHATSDRLGAPAGLALWKGTSFSTAIISGNLAKNGGALPVTLNETQPCG